MKGITPASEGQNEADHERTDQGGGKAEEASCIVSE
jgi:hypothetical protein